MDSWYCSDVTHLRMEGLIKHDLLRVRTAAMEWLMPGGEDVLVLPNGLNCGLRALP
jgi:hypothetical protein